MTRNADSTIDMYARNKGSALFAPTAVPVEHLERALFWLKSLVAHLEIDADDTLLKRTDPEGVVTEQNLGEDMRAMESALGFELEPKSVEHRS